MVCFEHPTVASVGICRSCNRAVCKVCAISFSKGLACSKECEKDVLELIEMNEAGKKIYGIGDYKTNRLAGGVLVWLVLSVVMWMVAALNYFFGSGIDYGTLAMAVGFSFVTAIVYRSSKRTGINC